MAYERLNDRSCIYMNTDTEIFKHFHVPESTDQEKPPIVLYEDKITLGTGAFQIHKYTHKNIRILTGAPGSGKSTSIRNETIQKNGKDLIFAPTHALLDEYEKAFRAAGHDCVHVYGLKESCQILKNDPEHKSEDAQKILKMHEQGVFAHLICTCMSCPHADRCKYHEQWHEVRDEEGQIRKTVLAPANLINIFDFKDFSGGGVIVEENNVNAELPALAFDEEKVINDLRKMQKFIINSFNIKSRVPLLNYRDLEYVISAIKKKNTGPLHQYRQSADETIRHYNLNVINDATESLDSRIERLCLIRMNNVIMYLYFFNRKKEYTAKEDKFKFECTIDGAIREMSIIDEMILSWKDDKDRLINYQDNSGRPPKDVLETWFDNEINALETHRKQVIDSVIDFATTHGVSTTNTESDPYIMLEKLKHEQIISKQPLTNDIELNFTDALFYKHMNSYVTVTMADTEIQFREDFFMKDIFNFQRFFPDYKVRVTVKNTERKNPDSRLICCSRDPYFRNFFDFDDKIKDKEIKKQREEEIKKINEHIRNKIKYLVKQGKKVCVLSHKPNLTSKGTLFGVPAFYYGYPVGTNDFSDFDVLIVYGTFNPGDKGYRDHWDKYYKLEHGEMPKIVYESNKLKRTFLPKDERLRRIYDAFITPIVYNLVHRVRLLNHPVDVYWHGYNIPGPLINELTLAIE